jgi:hypothetical protein
LWLPAAMVYAVRRGCEASLGAAARGVRRPWQCIFPAVRSTRWLGWPLRQVGACSSCDPKINRGANAELASSSSPTVVVTEICSGRFHFRTKRRLVTQANSLMPDHDGQQRSRGGAPPLPAPRAAGPGTRDEPGSAAATCEPSRGACSASGGRAACPPENCLFSRGHAAPTCAAPTCGRACRRGTRQCFQQHTCRAVAPLHRQKSRVAPEPAASAARLQLPRPTHARSSGGASLPALARPGKRADAVGRADETPSLAYAASHPEAGRTKLGGECQRYASPWAPADGRPRAATSTSAPITCGLQ